MGYQKINLGCGNDIRSGYVNIDIAKLPGVDLVYDLEKVPLPFANESVEEIVCQDVLEHINYIPLLQDLHRILITGGILKIRVPHFTSRNNFIDPTHRRLFSVETFDFFVKNADRDYYFPFSFKKINSCRITFEGWSKWFFLNKFIRPWVNSSKNTQRLYESTGWSRLFPAENIEIILEK